MQPRKIKILIGAAVIFLALLAFWFSSTATAQPVNADKIINMINTWKTKNAPKNQWVHHVYSVTLKESNGVLLPNGQLMPLTFINDDWFYLNQAGLVEKGVFTVKDTEGNILQQSAYQNNIMVNFTFGDRQEGQPPYPANIDLGFGAMIQEARNKGLTIKESLAANQAGKPGLVYLYSEGLKLPTQLGSEQVIVNSIQTQGSFDKATENFQQIQTIWILSDGSEVLYQTSQIISIESQEEAPSEILSILEMVK